MIHVSELLAAGYCTAECLCARSSDDDCFCRCRGELHGALVDHAVDFTPTLVDKNPWWIQCQRGGWSESLIKETAPVINANPFREQCRDYKRIVAARGEFEAVRRFGPKAFDYQWKRRGVVENPFLERDVLAAFYALLHYRKRSSTYGFIHPGEIQIGLFKEMEEALTVAVLTGECISGNPTGTMRAIYVLSGWKDPIYYGLEPDELPINPRLLSKMEGRSWDGDLANIFGLDGKAKIVERAS